MNNCSLFHAHVQKVLFRNVNPGVHLASFVQIQIFLISPTRHFPRFNYFQPLFLALEAVSKPISSHFPSKRHPGASSILEMPRKRKHSSEEEEEEAEEVENNIRAKRRAAVEARDRVAAKEGASDDEDEEDDLDEEDDDDKDEDYEGEGVGDEEGDEEGDEDDEEEEENDGAGGAEGEDDDEDDEEVEDEEQEPDTVECILADLEEPTSGILSIYSAIFCLNFR